MAKLVDGIHPFDLPLACGQSKSNVAQVQVSSSRRHNRIRHPSRKRLKRGWNSWAVAAIALAVWLWNWKLLIATASGISATLLVYTAQQWHWQRLRAKLDQLLEGNNRQLAIAAVSGGGALIVTYAAISLWGQP
ncbi:MAG: hypothetical protein HC925_03935 [Coleofasciculaceae cyanobacterium SM2_3_26]|nr:hypothetical protein [Coleofasciculaceae cyanobacterium SM2_3_26]